MRGSLKTRQLPMLLQAAGGLRFTLQRIIGTDSGHRDCISGGTSARDNA
jgi:hypothetical protein